MGVNGSCSGMKQSAPCRRNGYRKGGRSTRAGCNFVLSSIVADGHVDEHDFSGLATVMAGTYSDDGSYDRRARSSPRSPIKVWRSPTLVDKPEYDHT